MQDSVVMKRLMIFIGETDKYQGRSLSTAILERLKKEGCSGATVLKGASGFGVHRSVHTTSIMDLSSAMPEIVLLIDTPEKIDVVLPILKEMVSEGLIAIDDVQAIKLTK